MRPKASAALQQACSNADILSWNCNRLRAQEQATLAHLILPRPRQRIHTLPNVHEGLLPSYASGARVWVISRVVIANSITPLPDKYHELYASCNHVTVVVHIRSWTLRQCRCIFCGLPIFALDAYPGTL
jgi:hypothetical protein